MIQAGFSIIPGVDGELFTGARSSAAGLNKPFWAKITDYTGQSPTLYAWTEQTWQQLAPGSATSIGLADLSGGNSGTVLLNPIVDPNDNQLGIGSFVLVQKAYFDPAYDWVYAVVGGTSGSGTSGGDTTGLSYAKCLAQTPTNGLYDARLQTFNTDGTMNDNGESIWLRDGNLTLALINGEIYECGLTGNTNGRDVYTTCDFNLTVTDTFSGINYNRVRRILFDSSPTSYDNTKGDWVFTLDSTTRELTVRLNGFTGTYRLYYAYCDPVNGILYYTATVTASNGLTKTVVNNDQYPL